ncbi:MAG: EamA family transporter [Anaerovoracaceae bacterium]
MNNMIILMIFGVFISSISQVLLKKSANNNSKQSIVKQYLNPYVIIGYGLLGIAMLIPLYAYTVLELKYGAVIESLGFVFILILSVVFLKEKATYKRIIGNILIIAGVIIFGMNFS